MLQKIYISNQIYIFFSVIKESWKKIYQFAQKYEAVQLFFSIDNNNVSWAPNQHIRMISEGSFSFELITQEYFTL